MTQHIAEKSIPVHKATDGLGRITSLCEPGWFQLAEQWTNVTCLRCLRLSPETVKS